MASRERPQSFGKNASFGKKSPIAKDAESWHAAVIDHQAAHYEACNAREMRKNLLRLQREIIIDDIVQTRSAVLTQSPD